MIRLSVSMLLVVCLAGSAQAGSLHKAVKDGDAEQVRSLLAAGENINELDGSGNAPLHIAAVANDSAMIELLAESGADLNRLSEGFYGPTDAPLHIAVKRQNLDALKALASAGADLFVLSENSPAPLHMARKMGRVKAEHLLLSLGANRFVAAKIDDLLATADPSVGAEFAGNCAGCHSLEDVASEANADWEGPSLWNIVGSKKARQDGYQYSDALRKQGGSWSYQDLNGYLANPTAFMPGTKMDSTGTAVVDPKIRADVIAYLRTLSLDPRPLP